MPKISVIVPVYKVEAYLNRCIDSILNQTYADLELILVDDGSPDNCPAMCDQAAQRDSRVVVIHKENGGLSSARNAGLNIAQGEYVAFVDSDDYIDPDMYDTLLKVALETEADIVECGYRWVKPDTTYDRENTRKVDIYTNIEALEKLYFGDQMFGGISIVAWNKLYKASLFEHIRFCEGYIHEDVEATPRLLYQAKKIAKYNYNFYNFYFPVNSISRSPYGMKNIDAITMRKKTMEFFERVGLERYRTYMESLYIGSLHSNYYECNMRREKPEFREAAKRIRQEEKNYYPRISDNPYISQWRTKLFHLSPKVYCLLAYLYKTWKAKK